MVSQDSLGKFLDIAKYPSFRLARVTAMHMDTNTADLAFFDGSFGNEVPILSGLDSTNFGFNYNVTPTTTTGQEPAEGTFVPANSTEANLQDVDIYAVVGNFDSPRVSRSYFIMGFIAPRITAMKFDPALLNNPQGLMVFRHPSDVQVTIDDNACISIQHPCGARISVGDVNATDNSNLMQQKVDLNSKDINHGLYQIQKNIARQAGILLQTCVGSSILMNNDGNITVKDNNGNTVTMNNDSVTISTPNDFDVNSDNVNNNSTEGYNVSANQVSLDARINVTINALADVSITSVGPINATSASVINLTAPVINLNGETNIAGL